MITRLRLLRLFSASSNTEIQAPQVAQTSVDKLDADRQKALDRVNLAEADYLMPTTLRGKLRLAYNNLTQKVNLKKIPVFDMYGENEVNTFTFFNSFQDIEPCNIWTPLIQMTAPSEEFLERIEFLQYDYEQTKGRHFKTDEEIIEYHKKEAQNLCREFVTEAIQGTGFDFQEDFYCMPDRATQLHGNIPFVIYDRENEHLNYGFPMVFVMHQHIVKNRYLQELVFQDTNLGVAGAAQWAVNRLGSLVKMDKEFAKRVKEDERLQNCRILLSNGHNWRLYEFDLNYESRATHMYKPRSANQVFDQTGEKPIFKIGGDPSLKKVWNDFRHIELSLGLIKFAMNTPTEQEYHLQKTYEYLKEVEGTELMTPEEQEIIKKRELRSRILPKFIRKLYVGSNFFLEEVEREEKKKKMMIEKQNEASQIEENDFKK